MPSHMNSEEVEQLAHSKAHVVICPSTEGNLGDGFSLRAYMQSGVDGVSVQTYISLNPCEELVVRLWTKTASSKT